MTWKETFSRPIERLGGIIVWVSDTAGYVRWNDHVEYKFHMRKLDDVRAERKAHNFIERAKSDGVFDSIVPVPKTDCYVPDGVIETWIGSRSALQMYDKFDKIMLVGPAGCGKTMSVEAYAEMVHRPLYTVSCDVDTDKFDLVGKYILAPSDDGNHAMRWIDGIVTTAFKTGAILVFDEVNMTSPDVLSIINSALDERGYMMLKEGDGRIITKGEGFKCFCTMNEGYQGTVRLNEAFIDRFDIVVKFEYLSAVDEVKLLSKIVKTGVSEAIVNVISAIREGGDSGKNLRTDISHRMGISVARAFKRLDITFMDAFEIGLLNKCRSDERIPIREIIVAKLSRDTLLSKYEGFDAY